MIACRAPVAPFPMRATRQCAQHPAQRRGGVDVAAHRRIDTCDRVSCRAHGAFESGVLLQVEDDDHGLQARIQGGGVGLVSMRELAAELGGDCVIENRSDRSGTLVRARLPLQGPVRSR